MVAGEDRGDALVTMGRPPARVAPGKRGLRHDVGDADVVEDVSGSRNVRFSQDVILCPQTLPILQQKWGLRVYTAPALHWRCQRFPHG